MKVYVDGYAADGTDVLVGYKGAPKQMRRHSTSLHSRRPPGRCVGSRYF